MSEPGAHELRKFVVPEFIFGVGARHLVGQYARNLGAQRVLVVSDPGVIAAGWTADATRSLDAMHIPFVAFSDVSPNPRSEQVMAGAEVYLAEGCNAIVVVGGGSPMDCAKGIGVVSANRRDILTFEGVDEVPMPGPPLICVPTTAGSSADVSQFAIITDAARKVKIAIVSKTVVPDVALIDPQTTVTMDPELTAASGMDALTHAIEAYVSTANSPITDLHAQAAIRLIVANLAAAVASPNDLEVRGSMALASLHAGLAFSNASLGAVHAMAHAVGGWLDAVHGDSNALLLGAVIDYNFDAAPDRYRSIGEAFGVPDCGREDLIDAITRLMGSIGIGGALRTLGVGPEDLPQLAEHAMRDACMVTNPRSATQSDVEAVYARAL